MSKPSFKLITGDCVEELAKLKENSVDSIVCDPPYGLEFMGKEWDKLTRNLMNADADSADGKRKKKYGNSYSGRRSNLPDLSKTGGNEAQAWHEDWAKEAFRVLKPGGHLLAFGGTRTYHRLACGIEEAGFEIRDQIQWLYGSGFPKSHNVGKAIDKKAGKKRKVVGKRDTYTGKDKKANTFMASPRLMDITAPATDEAARWEGWGTALKPANEPIVVARKPFRGTVAENVQEHGTGAINIDGCRITTSDTLERAVGGFQNIGGYVGGKTNRRAKGITKEGGRWPANVILDEEAGALLDEQTGTLKSGKAKGEYGTHKQNGNNKIYGNGLNSSVPNQPPYGDEGGASRFFYCPKAAKKERNAGLDGFEAKEADIRSDKAKEVWTKMTAPHQNNHPTVKPVALMAYLCRLVTPPGGTVLDPFLGSGSTGLACIEEGFSFIGIEKDPEYMKIAEARIEHANKELKEEAKDND